ncbi:MAG: trehalose-phosphatase [Polyangiales bacterium]
MTLPAVQDLLARMQDFASPWLLALDVDGTLAPIALEANKATIPVPCQADLRRLAACADLHLALITGRDAAALERLIDLPAAWRATEHGRVLARPGERPNSAAICPDAAARLAAFGTWARTHLAGRGAVLEEKAQALAVHVRALAARDAGAAAAVLDQAATAGRQHGLHPRAGRAVCELELQPGDKGAALSHIADALQVGPRLVYAGDDLTDLPAIRVATARGGIGVFVRSAERADAPTEASLCLDGPTAVHAWVQALAERCAAGTH